MKKFLKRLQRGEKGFTLIELLVVVAILGVLAAVAVPNVSKFMNKGQDEAGKTELHNVQTAVMAMMADRGLTTVNATADEEDMGAFPTGAPLWGAVNARYINTEFTQWYYTVEADGTVTQGSKVP